SASAIAEERGQQSPGFPAQRIEFLSTSTGRYRLLRLVERGVSPCGVAPEPIVIPSSSRRPVQKLADPVDVATFHIPLDLKRQELHIVGKAGERGTQSRSDAGIVAGRGIAGIGRRSLTDLPAQQAQCFRGAEEWAVRMCRGPQFVARRGSGKGAS